LPSSRKNSGRVLASNRIGCARKKIGSGRGEEKIEDHAEHVRSPTIREGNAALAHARLLTQPRTKQRSIKLGMQYVPPELREDLVKSKRATRQVTGRLDRDRRHSRNGPLPHYVFGRQAQRRANGRGGGSVGNEIHQITDHSPTAFYAGGVKIDRLQRQWEEIDEVQEKTKIKILKGTESDIVADGSLDYPDWILEQFDVIVASIHSRYKMDEDKMTRRIVDSDASAGFQDLGTRVGAIDSETAAV